MKRFEQSGYSREEVTNKEEFKSFLAKIIDGGGSNLLFAANVDHHKHMNELTTLIQKRFGSFLLKSIFCQRNPDTDEMDIFVSFRMIAPIQAFADIDYLFHDIPYVSGSSVISMSELTSEKFDSKMEMH